MTYVGGLRASLGTGRTQESIEGLESIVLTWGWADKDIFIRLDRAVHSMIRLRDQMGACGRARTKCIPYASAITPGSSVVECMVLSICDMHLHLKAA